MQNIIFKSELAVTITTQILSTIDIPALAYAEELSNQIQYAEMQTITSKSEQAVTTIIQIP